MLFLLATLPNWWKREGTLLDSIQGKNSRWFCTYYTIIHTIIMNITYSRRCQGQVWGLSAALFKFCMRMKDMQGNIGHHQVGGNLVWNETTRLMKHAPLPTTMCNCLTSVVLINRSHWASRTWTPCAKWWFPWLHEAARQGTSEETSFFKNHSTH